MLFFKLLFIFGSVQISLAQVTLKKNILLSRQKRYLLFPKGANFVITFSGVKSVMVKNPKNTNLVMECDVPFPLPYETGLLRKYRKRLKQRLQRRELLDQFATSVGVFGVNGNACVQQMICQANQYIQNSRKSFIGDLISTIFYDLTLTDSGNKIVGPLEDHDFPYDCDDHCNLNRECPIPFYDLLMKTFSSISY